GTEMTSPLPTGSYVGTGNIDYVHGHTFERYLLMLFGLRALQRRNEYSMATKLKDAGKFDDVVFHYIKEDGLCTRMLQAKHRGQNREITVEDLLDRSASSRFGLKAYFESYLKIR